MIAALFGTPEENEYAAQRPRGSKSLPRRLPREASRIRESAHGKMARGEPRSQCGEFSQLAQEEPGSSSSLQQGLARRKPRTGKANAARVARADELQFVGEAEGRFCCSRSAGSWVDACGLQSASLGAGRWVRDLRFARSKDERGASTVRRPLSLIGPRTRHPLLRLQYAAWEGER
jgi:hypothetical protein